MHNTDVETVSIFVGRNRATVDLFVLGSFEDVSNAVRRLFYSKIFLHRVLNEWIGTCYRLS